MASPNDVSMQEPRDLNFNLWIYNKDLKKLNVYIRSETYYAYYDSLVSNFERQDKGYR